MARYFESAQACDERVKEIGLTEALLALHAQSWTAFSILAFATDYVPGASPPELFVKEIFEPLGVDGKFKPMVKRLFVEAYTMAAQDVQNRADGSKDPDEPRKMPNAERERRRDTLQSRLTGFRLEGDLPHPTC